MAGGCCFKTAGGVGVLLAVIVLIGALVIEVWFGDFLKAEIKAVVSVTSVDSPAYKAFRNATEVVDIQEDYYLFNVTNPWEVAHEGADVKVSQVGPFTFKLHKYCPEVNTSWSTEGTLSFMAQTSYEFISGPADLPADFYSTVNISTYRLGVLGAMKELEYMKTVNSSTDRLEDKIGLFVLAECVEKFGVDSPFINVTVQEVLWGYKDPFLECMHQDPMVAALHQPDTSSSSKFLNAIYSGGDYSKTVKAPPKNKENEYAMYQGMTELPYWGSKYANMINGTSGTAIEPGTAKVGNFAPIWIDTFLRSATFIGREKTKYKGVDVVRYGLNLDDLQSGDVNPDNKAFYITTTGIQPYPPSVNVPVYFGQPYYHNANLTGIKVDWVGNSQGWNKKVDQIDTYADFEPHTGGLFKVHKRIQASAKLGYNPMFKFTEKWTDTYAPIFWADEHMELSDHNVKEFKELLGLALLVLDFGAFALLGLAALIIFLSVGLCCCGRRASKRETERETEQHGAYSGGLGNVNN